MPDADLPDSPPARRGPLHAALNLLRGGLIGLVETIPGVSGGTVALVVGIYDDLITSASHVISGFRSLITGPNRTSSFAGHLKRANWWLIIPVMIGMAAAVFTIAGPMARLVEDHPEPTRALFFGMVLISAIVPIRLAGQQFTVKRAALMIAGGVAAFVIVSLPATTLSPNPVTIIASAAVAVSALVLPGLSGSFILLSLGLYQPTLTAVDERDFAYIGLFVLGAMLGLVVIVKLLRMVLARAYAATMFTLAGVMVGALRSLWPWQTEAGNLQGPGDNLGSIAGVALAGGAVVGVMIVADIVITNRRQREAARRVMRQEP